MTVSIKKAEIIIPTSPSTIDSTIHSSKQTIAKPMDSSRKSNATQQIGRQRINQKRAQNKQ
ncbi:hypothetical protein AAAT34_11580 [Hallella faecis]|uniref:Uncharacterized protein n=1 Tax=Hallella faecis TaxID=2841596 RepID=A0ABV1FTD4_9BACT|nr:hypothetical protein [Hallella faecis]